MNILELDTNLFLQINNIQNSVLDFLASGISWITEFVFLWLFICLLIFIFDKKDRKRKISLIVLSLIASTWIVNVIFKTFIVRTRPYLVLEGVKILGRIWANNSFPSGHTAATFAAIVILLYLFKVHSKLLIGLSILFGLFLGFARIYVGMHYPLDVLVGIIVGIAASLLVIWFDKQIKFKKK